MAQATIGSISEGTLRSEDLIEAFLWELRRLSPQAADGIEAAYPDYADAEEDSEFWDDVAPDMVAALFDALNTFAPAFCTFGATEGDGSCFGFWPDLESAREESLVVNDTDDPRIATSVFEYVMDVNDHGNVTLYRRDGANLIEEWSIV